MNGTVWALTVLPNGELIAGGLFSRAGDVTANNIARWDGSSWAPLGTGILVEDAEDWGGVWALTVLPNGDLIAGGHFTTAGDVGVNNIARTHWDGFAWSWYALGNGIPHASWGPSALAVMPNGDLIAGGWFWSAGDGVPVNHIARARWDELSDSWSWAPLGSGMDRQVSALMVLPDGDLVAGGVFSMAGGVSANSIAHAHWDESTDTWSWAPIGSGMDESLLVPGKRLPVSALSVLPNGDVIAGGQFSAAGGVPANGIARAHWDGLAWYWYPLGSGLHDYGDVRTMTVLPNGDLVAGGIFSTAGGVSVNNIARWDESSWYPLGSGTNGGIHSLSILPNGDLVAGGDFTMVGGVNANNIARWDGSSWYPLGSGIDGSVYALTVLPNGDLVAGGSFDTAGEVVVHSIARWNGSSWVPLGGGVCGVEGASVYALTVLPNGELVAGGYFTTSGSIIANRVARWDGSSWAPLGSGMSGGVLPIVHALTVVPNGDLVAAGSFTKAGNVSANNIARWDGSSWYPLGSGIQGIPQLGGVYALTVLPNGNIIADGNFTSAGSVSANNIAHARWDGSSWSWGPLGDGLDTPIIQCYGCHLPFALTVLPNGDLVAGGIFSMAGGVSVNNIARAHWDGLAWSWGPLGSGIGGGEWPYVAALTVLPNGDLVAGGDFTTAGGEVSAYWARWGRPYDDLDGSGRVDLNDLTLFEPCLGGPAVAYDVGCDCADSDDDGDVDLYDFAAFQRAFRGFPTPKDPYIPVLVPGDTFVYSDRREGTINGDPVRAVGTTTRTVLDDPVIDKVGNTASVICETFSGVLNEETPVSDSNLSYFSQDYDGTTYVHGGADDCTDLSCEWFVLIPPEGKFRTLSSPITIGATNEWNVTYNDTCNAETREAGRNTVVGVETINVPAGQFDTYVIEWEGTVTKGTATESYWMTTWFGPFGANIRLEIDLIYIDDGTNVIGHHVRELIETNVPY